MSFPIERGEYVVVLGPSSVGSRSRLCGYTSSYTPYSVYISADSTILACRKEGVYLPLTGK